LKFFVQAGWDHVPHLNPDVIAEMAKAFPPHELEARRNGTPSLGSGAVYPIHPDEYTVADFEMPAFWPRAFGMDIGWRRTAVVWGAHDRDSDIVYLYSEHYAGEQIPKVHADAIQSRGAYIPGAIDPASNGRSQIDGARMIELYQAEGLDLEPADNSVEAGIYAVWQRLAGGKLKIFASLTNLLGEMKLYRRDEKGRIVKERDHACDAMRYLIMSGLERAKTPPLKRSPYSFGSGGRVFSG